ncbi:hypothetical protein ANCDUO_10173 [Ancylostoma duodenale]|uniref:Uncharacterized protein n=1 Tax=Ancylostoma duodenale TaxID=51022 RepID=A0A0C2GEJ5_9BILA|nr:hypothetical protein ANCDUO_10173 [Ancylostoma duodenale]
MPFLCRPSTRKASRRLQNVPVLSASPSYVRIWCFCVFVCVCVCIHRRRATLPRVCGAGRVVVALVSMLRRIVEWWGDVSIL